MGYFYLILGMTFWMGLFFGAAWLDRRRAGAYRGFRGTFPHRLPVSLLLTKKMRFDQLIVITRVMPNADCPGWEQVGPFYVRAAPVVLAHLNHSDAFAKLIQALLVEPAEVESVTIQPDQICLSLGFDRASDGTLDSRSLIDRADDCLEALVQDFKELPATTDDGVPMPAGAGAFATMVLLNLTMVTTTFEGARKYQMYPGELADTWWALGLITVTVVVNWLALLVLMPNSPTRKHWHLAILVSMVVAVMGGYHGPVRYVNNLEVAAPSVELMQVGAVYPRRKKGQRDTVQLYRFNDYLRGPTTGVTFLEFSPNEPDWKKVQHRCLNVTTSTGKLGLRVITGYDFLTNLELAAASTAVREFCGASSIGGSPSPRPKHF
jgi:hypothetical protein